MTMVMRGKTCTHSRVINMQKHNSRMQKPKAVTFVSFRKEGSRMEITQLLALFVMALLLQVLKTEIKKEIYLTSSYGKKVEHVFIQK